MRIGVIKLNKIIEMVKGIDGYLKNIRRELHENAEVSMQEKKTAGIIERELLSMNCFEIKTNVYGYGIIADLKGKYTGKTIALRADMDALQISETVDVPWKAKDPDTMHACGHDNHMAILLGTAKLLSELKDELHGNVRLIFQPAEEFSPIGGSRGMIEAGALEGVDAIFGAHVWPELEVGKIGIKEGPMMAASDRFLIEFDGKSSHAAKPDEGIDSIIAAMQCINSLQTIVSRNIDPMESAVITVGKIIGGTRYNIIADKCRLEGTCRTFNPKVRSLIENKMMNIVDGISKASGCQGKLKYEHGYMSLLNDKKMTEYVKKVVKDVYNEEAIDIKAGMAAEDFSFYLAEKPGAFICLGTSKPGETVYPLHNGKYNPSEEVLCRGVGLFLGLVLYFNK